MTIEETIAAFGKACTDLACDEQDSVLMPARNARALLEYIQVLEAVAEAARDSYSYGEQLDKALDALRALTPGAAP